MKWLQCYGYSGAKMIYSAHVWGWSSTKRSSTRDAEWTALKLFEAANEQYVPALSCRGVAVSPGTS